MFRDRVAPRRASRHTAARFTDDMFSREVLDHFQNPRGAGDLPEATARVEVSNPACGDVMQLAARVEDGRLRRSAFPRPRLRHFNGLRLVASRLARRQDARASPRPHSERDFRRSRRTAARHISRRPTRLRRARNAPRRNSLGSLICIRIPWSSSAAACWQISPCPLCSLCYIFSGLYARKPRNHFASCAQRCVPLRRLCVLRACLPARRPLRYLFSCFWLFDRLHACGTWHWSYAARYLSPRARRNVSGSFRFSTTPSSSVGTSMTSAACAQTTARAPKSSGAASNSGKSERAKIMG